MANRVFKYKLAIEDHQKLTLPSRCTILSVINQNEEVVLYAKVNDEEKNTSDIDIYIHGTGHEVEREADLFLGTVALRNDALILHVFADSSQFYWNEIFPSKRLTY